MVIYTKAQLDAIHQKRLKQLLDYAGGPTHLARMLGVSAQTISGWCRRNRVSMAGAIAVSKHPYLSKTFPPNYLRPTKFTADDTE